MGLRERIQQAGDIPFKDEIILDCADLKQNPFLIETRFASNTSIPVSNIIGSSHPNYQGISWSNFMAGGKRIESRIKQVDESPEYYYAPGQKDHIGFLKFSNGYFIEAGNHRSVIAKFLFFLDDKYNQYLHGVYVTEYIFDKKGEFLVNDLINTIDSFSYQGIINIAIECIKENKQSVINTEVSSFFHTRITITNSKNNKKIVIKNLQKDKKRQRVQNLITAINQRTWWSRWFSKNEFAKFVG